MCLRRAPEKYITGAMANVGAALDRAGLSYISEVTYEIKFILLSSEISLQFISFVRIVPTVNAHKNHEDYKMWKNLFTT
jgi:hypothetical protein